MKNLSSLCLTAVALFMLPDAVAARVMVHAGHVIQQRVRRATQVEFEPFTVTVPAHWSFQALIEPKPVGRDGMTIDFIAAPGDLKGSRVYVGVRERASKMTMDQRRKSLASQKGHRFKTVSWNGLHWILDQFQGVHPHTTAWSAHLVRSGKEYLLVAESPNKIRPRFEPQIISIMKSVTFSSRPASNRSH